MHGQTRRKMAVAAALLLACACSWGVRAQESEMELRAERLVVTARAELTAGRPEHAETLLQQCLELQPDWAAPRQWLALAHQMQGDEAAARAQYADLQALTYDFCPWGRTNPAEGREAVISAETLTMWLVNASRIEQGLRPLRPEPRLTLAARSNALAMRDLGFFDHQSPVAGQTTPSDRFFFMFGFLPQWVAENIGRMRGAQPVLDADRITAMHQGFLQSEGHRRNILLPETTSFGVGIATNPEGAFWLCALFASYEEPR